MSYLIYWNSCMNLHDNIIIVPASRSLCFVVLRSSGVWHIPAEKWNKNELFGFLLKINLTLWLQFIYQKKVHESWNCWLLNDPCDVLYLLYEWLFIVFICHISYYSTITFQTLFTIKPRNFYEQKMDIIRIILG